MIKDVAKDVLQELKKFSVGSKQWIAVLQSSTQSKLNENKLVSILTELAKAGYTLEEIGQILGNTILTQEYIDQFAALPTTDEIKQGVIQFFTNPTGSFVSVSDTEFTASSEPLVSGVDAFIGFSDAVSGRIDFPVGRRVTVDVLEGTPLTAGFTFYTKDVGIPLIVPVSVGVSSTTASEVVRSAAGNSFAASINSFDVERKSDGIYVNSQLLTDAADLPAEELSAHFGCGADSPFILGMSISEVSESIGAIL